MYFMTKYSMDGCRIMGPMKKFDCALVITHVAHRKIAPFDPVEGPYSSLAQALTMFIKSVKVFGLPLEGYDNEIVYGTWGKTKRKQIPRFLGRWPVLKFVIDIFLDSLALIRWAIRNRDKNRLVIGVDPLSCLPLWIFKKIFGYTLVFHCVDFNKHRFDNWAMQCIYELADEWASKFSDQTWVICEALKEYKKRNYHIESFYVPNSVVFDSSVYKKGLLERTGNKMVWTGSLLTARQFDVLFGVLSLIQKKIRPDMGFVIAPTKDHDKFETYVKKYRLKRVELLKLNSRAVFQQVAAKCDVGIALYDELFGSTEFIEPMKVWDFLLCGLPFVVSSEPSLSQMIKESGVAYLMKPKNKIPDERSLKLFLSKQNLVLKSTSCLKIAKHYDIKKQIKERLTMLLLLK